MTAAAVVAELRAHGFTLESTSNGIRISPASRLTPELRAAIARHKQQILEQLAHERTSTSPTTPPSCPVCHSPMIRVTTKLPDLPRAWWCEHCLPLPATRQDPRRVAQ